MTRTRVWPAHAALAALAIVALYAHTRHYGLYWDDFDVLRRWTWTDLARAFTGDYRPWAREGIYFYRPLTSAYYAVISSAFGLNSTALHLIPFVTLTVAAMLTGVFVERETGSRRTGLSATLLYAVHPLTATAVGPWIANQYQGFVVIAVLCALLTWRRQTTDGTPPGLPLTAALVAAAWLKEDGLLLGPTLLVLQVARARFVRDVPMPSRRFALSLLLLTAGLVLWRALWLPVQFGYGVPDAGRAIANLTRAWRYALLWHEGGTRLAWLLTAMKLALTAGALTHLARHPRSASARLALTGFVLIAIMNLPLVMVSSENRWHVVGLGAVLISVGAIAAVRQPWRWAALLTVAIVFAAGAWPRIAVFAPCSDDSRVHYRWAMTLPELPPELHAWLATRDDACRAGEYEPFAVPMRSLTWGAR